MTDHTEPVSLRKSGGVHVYYVLPVRDGESGFAYGVFEHVSTWPSDAIATGQLTELETADKRRTMLAAEAREAITAWEDAADGPSEDDEYEAASDLADALGALLDALKASSLI